MSPYRCLKMCLWFLAYDFVTHTTLVPCAEEVRCGDGKDFRMTLPRRHDVREKRMYIVVDILSLLNPSFFNWYLQQCQFCLLHHAFITAGRCKYARAYFTRIPRCLSESLMKTFSLLICHCSWMCNLLTTVSGFRIEATCFIVRIYRYRIRCNLRACDCMK